jgi:phosphomannomutase
MSIFDQSIFRAYDMRGTYPNHMNEQVGYAAGQAFVHVMQAKTVVVGRDVRSTGVSIQDAVIRGITDAGANVIEVGVISTEMLYFAAATLDCEGGISVTASHNPAQWNGLKFIGPKAEPLTREGKLGEIYDHIQAGHKISQFEKGSVQHHNLLPDYIAFLKKFMPANLPSLKVAANVNFGANGKVVDAALEGQPLELLRLNWQEDGTFPKGTPDPLLPSNRKEIISLIKAEKAHFGAAWDADADRCFFYDEQGRFFHGYYITALLIKYFLNDEAGANVVCERRLTWANMDAAAEGKGTVIWSKTGHGYIKENMRKASAIFGGESSGHYYFRDAFYCDSGMVTFLAILGIFAKEIEAGRTVGHLLDYYLERYPISLQELNYITPDAKKIIDTASEKYADAEQTHEDGLTVEYPTWRFSLRMSSNEPVLRLNYEARSKEELDQRAQELTSFVESFGATLRNDD